VCGAKKRTLEEKTRKDVQYKFYNTTAVPWLVHSSEIRTLRRTDERALAISIKLQYFLETIVLDETARAVLEEYNGAHTRGPND
jgi:hypothetical protein